MSRRRADLGRTGEDLAAARLEELGWAILDRNWRCGLGEIDIVARDGAVLVIVEVRARRGRRFGTPEESIGVAKRARLARLAVAYCQEAGWDGPCRVDVVAVDVSPEGAPSRIAHYRNAVSGAWYRP